MHAISVISCNYLQIDIATNASHHSAENTPPFSYKGSSPLCCNHPTHLATNAPLNSATHKVGLNHVGVCSKIGTMYQLSQFIHNARETNRHPISVHIHVLKWYTCIEHAMVLQVNDVWLWSRLRLQDTVITFLYSNYRIQACMRLTLPLKKVALACNSCTGWVGYSWWKYQVV